MIKRLSDPKLLDVLFPFHFILDHELAYVQIGSSLKKILPDPLSFEHDFKLVRPGLGIEYTFESISSYSDQVFILRPTSVDAISMVKGQFVLLEESKQLLFVGSPWIMNEDSFAKAGLKIRDFAIHDSLIDLLQHLRVQQMTVEDMNQVNKMLTRKNEELVSLNKEMAAARQDLELKNSELHKINAELDRFVYSISHDLRSPLLSIKGILQLIPIKEKTTDGTNKLLQLAEKSVNRLDQTVQEILDYSRNSRLDLKITEFSIIQMIEGIFADLKYSTEENVDCTLEISGSANIKADKYRLETLLKNVIGNAVKYRNRESNNPWVKVLVKNDKTHCTITVSDNGTGISEKSLPKIFDMFYRGSNAVSGTGLGLYICKEIIHRLGGTMDVKSTAGKGSVFSISFPLM
ncbi:MAG: ATP-binding protein [Bacteroidota bacterium]